MNRIVIKEITQNRRSKFGHYVGEFATPDICHILASEDYDFVFFDMEHPGFSIETLKSAVRYFEANGVAMIVWTHCNDDEMIAHICDDGAEGVMAPMIKDAAEAAMVVQHMKYLINKARGPIVHQKVLAEALQSHVIAGKGLDLFEKEPPDADDRLLQLDNVIVTPHALCRTNQCFAGIGAADVASVLAVYDGRRPAGLQKQSVIAQKGFMGELERYQKCSYREGQV